MFFSIPHLTLLNQCQQYCNWSNFMSVTPTIFQRFFSYVLPQVEMWASQLLGFFLMSKNTQYQAFTLMINFSTPIHSWEKNIKYLFLIPFLSLLLSVATVVFMRALESSTLTNGLDLHSKSLLESFIVNEFMTQSQLPEQKSSIFHIQILMTGIQEEVVIPRYTWRYIFTRWGNFKTILPKYRAQPTK